MPNQPERKKNLRNYYRILHVQPDAPIEIIHSSYRTLMQRLKCHPDLGGDEWDAALINTAYSVLCDPEKRAKYDRELNGIPKLRRSKKQSSSGVSSKQEKKSEPEPNLASCLFCREPHFFGLAIPSDALCKRCQSPLNQSQKHQFNDTEGRRATRVEDTKRISFYTSWPAKSSHSGIIQNISIGGALFLTMQEIKKNSYIKIDTEHFSAIGQVVNSRQLQNHEGQWQINIAFKTLQFKEKRGSFISFKI